jgi:hypothetical protein
MQSKTGKPPKAGGERRELLAERLRDNLRRRKAQERERAQPKQPAAAAPPKSAGK